MTEPTPIRKRVDGRSKRMKALIVGEAMVVGVTRAARKHNIPATTVQYWRDSPEFARLRDEKREEVAADVWGAFQAGIRRIVQLIPQTDDLQKVAVATGIIYDKFALISGEATGRTEHRDITGTLSDHEQDTLAGILRDAVKVDAGS